MPKVCYQAFSSTIEGYNKYQNFYFFAVISESVYIQYKGMQFIMGPWVKSMDGSVKSFDIKKQLWSLASQVL